MNKQRLLKNFAAAWPLFGLCLILALTGCTRAYYRRQADAQVSSIVAQKASHPHWPLENYSIQVDPASRMFDPFSPDRPPMPPDDPTSHQLMHNIDGYRGFPRWHKSGDTPHVQNPEWTNFLPVNSDGALELDAERALLVARLHSPDYQQNLETLYLSALDVSFERFRFDAQFFSGYSADYLADGPLRNFPNGPRRQAAAVAGTSRSVSQLTAPAFPTASMTKLGTTGTELAVNLANSIVWNFSGPNTNATNTILDFTLFQPLLRRAGRDRILERLTVAERTLLANVRQLEHYRRGFYLQVVTGRNAGQGPSRRGGVLGGSGLEGFSGIGGGFGQIGAAITNAGGGQAGAAATAAGAAQAGGFFGLLQRQQDIRNQEANIAALRSSLAQFTEFNKANRIDYLQVQQARQALYNAQSRLMNSENDYRNALDQYKVQIGLPPQLDVQIRDDMLDQFTLIDSAIVPQQNRLTELQSAVGNTIVEILPASPEPGVAPPDLRWSPELVAHLRKLKELLSQAQNVRKQLKTVNVPRANADIEGLIAAIPTRRTDLLLLEKRLRESTDPDAAAAVADRGRLDPLPDKLREGLNAAVERLDRFEAELQKIDEDIDSILATGEAMAPADLLTELRTKVFASLPSELNEMAGNVLEISLVQARARTDGASLTPIDMPADTALEIARNYRRDWMNARAQLVDTWRLVEFNADDLEASLDLVFSGDVQNVGNNPVAFRSTAGRLRMGFQFDAPITRVSERNLYRQSIIEYQQARRSYYQVGDQISRGLRQTIRTVELNQLNFELRRSAVHVAVEQVELARLRLQQPPAVGAVNTQLGATTARDLVSALTDLQNAQNDFLSVYINYEVLRRTLDQDIGTMRLDSQGLWIDPGAIGLRYGYPDLSTCENCPAELLAPQEDLEPVPEDIGTPPIVDPPPIRPAPLPAPGALPKAMPKAAADRVTIAPNPLRSKAKTTAPEEKAVEGKSEVGVVSYLDDKEKQKTEPRRAELPPLPPLREPKPAKK